MNVGTLEIQMAMDLARLRQDMEQMKSLVGGAMDSINRVVSVAKTGLVAFAGVASVGAFAGMINGAIEAQAALHDMSQATGLSVAALGEFRKIGAYTETSADSIAGAVLKLSKNMALTDEEGKGAALAIKALGLDFDSFKKLSPEQQMLEVAKSMSGFKDGADKSAAAMLLFGKEGAKLIPFLADLAESADDINAKLTDQEKASRAAAAAMADAYGDNLTKIHKESEAWKKDLSMGLLPAMYETTEAFLQMSGGAGGIKAKISELARDGTLAEWARNGMEALSYLVDVGQALFLLLPMIGKAIAGLVAANVQAFSAISDSVGKVLRGDFAGAVDSMRDGFRAVGTIGQDVASDVSEIWNKKLIGQSFRETMSSLKGVQVEAKRAGKDLDLKDVLAANEAAKKREAAATKAAAEETKKLIAMYEAAEKAGQDLIAALGLKNDQLQLEVELGRKLTPVETENLKLTRDLASGKVLLSKADEQAARAAIEHGAALEREIAWQQESHKANLAQVESTDKRIEQLQAETEKQREANAELLLNAEQIGEVRRAKLLDLAASADRKAALLDEIDWTGQLGDQQRELAKAYRDSAAVASEGAAVKAAKEAQDAWQKTIDSVGQGLTDSLFRAFESGKGFWSTLWDGIKNTVKTTALKLVIQGVDGKGGVMGSLLSLVGLGSPGTASAGTGGGLGGMGGLSGIGSALGSLLGSGGWMQNFGGNVTGMAGDAGMWLMQNGFDKIGGSLLGNASAIGDFAGMAGDALGYLGAIKSLTDGKYGAAAGSAIGTFFGGPIGGTIGNLIGGAVDKLFGGNGTHHSGAGIYSDGSTSVNVKDAKYGLGAAYGDSVNKYYNQSIADALTTLSSGSAKMLNELSASFGGKGGYGVGSYFASDNDRGSNFGRSVLLNGQVLSEAHGNNLDKDASKGLQQLTDALAGQVRDAMLQIDVPDWARKQLQSLGSGATMEQLAQAVQAIQQTQAALKGIGDAFAPLGGVFGRIAGLSGEATMQLAQFAGGIDALVAKTQSFVKNYYSEGEQNAIAAAQIQKALSDAGITTTLGSRDDFKALVQSTDVQTEDGRKQLALLLNLNEAFAPVADYLKAQGTTLADLAAQAPQAAALQALTDSTTTSLDLQQQSADRLVQLDDTFNSVGATLQASLQGLTASVEAGLAQVAANTAAMNNRLSRWDGGDGMATVAA